MGRQRWRKNKENSNLLWGNSSPCHTMILLSFQLACLNVTSTPGMSLTGISLPMFRPWSPVEWASISSRGTRVICPDAELSRYTTRKGYCLLIFGSVELLGSYSSQLIPSLKTMVTRIYLCSCTTS